MSIKRIKVITSHAGHARFLAECDDPNGDGYIYTGEVPRMVATPYASGPTHATARWNGREVFVAETSHRRYEVFEVSR